MSTLLPTSFCSFSFKPLPLERKSHRGELLMYCHHHPPVFETQAVIYLLFTPVISWK